MQEKHCSLDKRGNFQLKKQNKKTYGRWLNYFNNSKFILRPDFCKQFFMQIVLQNGSVKTSFGKWMYLKISLLLKELQGTRDTLYMKRQLKNLWADCCCCLPSCYFIYAIIFTMYRKHIAREAYLESPQKYTMELFCKRANDFKPLNCFSKKNFVIDLWHGSKYASEWQR